MQDASFRIRGSEAGGELSNWDCSHLAKEEEACPSELFLGTLPLESKPDSFLNMSHPPPSLRSLTLHSLELKWHICKKMSATTCWTKLQQDDGKQQTTTTTTTTYQQQHHHHNNNNDDNNDNDNNTTSQESSLQSLDQSKGSQESGLNSFDLDNENPESSFGSDLDRLSLDSFAPDGETGFSSSDHQCEASSLTTLGKTMTIGFSLGSLTQENQEGDDSLEPLGIQA